jgi:hypothetical protein
MRTPIDFPKACFVCFLLAATSAFGQTAQTPPKALPQGAVSSGASKATPGSASKPAGGPAQPNLSKDECSKLGGSVVAEPACDSGQVCWRGDYNGKVFNVCISKIQQ